MKRFTLCKKLGGKFARASPLGRDDGKHWSHQPGGWFSARKLLPVFRKLRGC
jgi:hypothetical protein